MAYFTQFFDPLKCLSDACTLDHQRYYSESGFAHGVTLHKSINVQQSNNSVQASPFAPFLNNFEKTTYSCNEQYSGQVSQAQTYPNNTVALQAFEFYPSSTQMEYTYVRVNFITLISALGGLMYTLRTISNNWVNKLSDYSIDEDMMKMLYATEKS